MSDYLDANNEELLKDFFAEAEQQVETLESNILVIENDPSNHEAIDEIFRAAHTLKGGSATVEMTELSTFCHDVEDLLDALRGGAVGVTEPIVDVLLTAIDTIKVMLETRSNGSVYQEDVSPLVQKIKAFIPEKSGKKKAPVQMPKGMVTPKPVAPPPPVAESSSMPPIPPLSDSDLEEIKEACPDGNKIWVINVTFDESNPMNSVGGIQVFAALKSRGVVLKTVPDFEALYEDEFHPQVVYYIATTCGQDELEDTCFLDDVTLASDAHPLDQKSSASAPAPAPQKVVETRAPEPEPEQEIPEPPAVQDNSSAVPATTANVQQAKKSVAPATHAAQTGSILRVDSKRVDNLMNLVSETVITKAVFNQTGLQFADLQLKLQNLNAVYKEKQRHAIEAIPKLLEEFQNGASQRKSVRP